MSAFLVKAGLGFLLAVSLLVEPVVARAQGAGEAPQESVLGSPSSGTRTFGTALVGHTLQAFAFAGFAAADSAVFGANGTGSRFCSGAACFFEAAALLPAGASVTFIELEACDTNPAASVTATLYRIPNLEASFNVLATVSTGSAATPGCDFFSVSVGTPLSIDNFLNTYFVQVQITGTTNTTRFQAVRIFYNLVVSPAPATATFGDVPVGHIFFKFIEALAAAGITGGCNVAPPLYCPDDFVTRGQMAAFISKALGLQFGL